MVVRKSLSSNAAVVLAAATITFANAGIAQVFGAGDVDSEQRFERLHVAALEAMREAPLLSPEEYLPSETGVARSDEQRILRLIAEKQLDRALKDVEALEKKQPGVAEVSNLKGAVYLARKDVANARKSFEQALALNPLSMVAATSLAQLDLRDKKPEMARQRFESILAKDRSNTDAMMGIAGVAAATGNDEEYVAWLERAAQAGPSQIRPRVALAKHYLTKRNVQKALSWAGEARKIAEENLQVLDILGAAQLAAGQLENAVATYTTLARLAYTNPVAHYRLAVAQTAMQNDIAAKSSLNLALKLKPDYIEAKELLAVNEISSGRYSEGLRLAKEIQKQNPNSAVGIALEGDVAMAQKDFAAAQRAYEKAFAQRKNNMLALKLASAYVAAGKTKEGDAVLVSWLSRQPGDNVVRENLATSYVRSGQSKLAIEQFQLIVKAEPNNASALNHLAWLYQQEKDPRALPTAEQAFKLQPDNADIVDTLGWILVERGDTTRGLELLRKATDMAPTSSIIRYHLAVTLARTGDNLRARRELERVLDRKGEFPERADAEALLARLPK